MQVALEEEMNGHLVETFIMEPLYSKRKRKGVLEDENS